MPRPRTKLPPKVDGVDTYQLLSEWPVEGVAEADAAARCGLPVERFRELLGKPAKDGRPTVRPVDARASEAWLVGHGRRVTWLWSQLHNPDTKNIGRPIYELKAKYGFADVPKQEPAAVESLVKIGKLVLPAPVDRAEWAKSIAPPVKAKLVEEVERG